ncbi:MAG TPA: hypothetical protein V6C89_06330 [Drouetiella sp.]|jgi:hypothetical protein
MSRGASSEEIMDRMYLKNTLEQLQREKDAHDTKFGDNPVHAKCLPNFDTAIAKLQKELDKFNEENPVQG